MSVPTRAIVLVGLVACTGDDPPKLLDTGWFDKATQETDGCQDKFVSFAPDDGATGWYWRDRPRGATQTDRTLRYDVTLAATDGREVPADMVWAEGNLKYELDWDGWLEPDTDYTMVLKDCEAQQEIRFRTSDLGEPLQGGPGSLIGNTFLIDLAEADWVEPPTLGPLVAIYVRDPFLLEVAYADEEVLQLIGAPGRLQGDDVVQDTSVPSWNFGRVPFLDQPYFDAQSERVSLQYRFGDDVVDIPVSDFVLQGTFSSDGRRVGGAVLAGNADTRFVGAAITNDNPAGLCDIAASQGVSCEPCPTDGEPYCLFLRARSVAGTLLPGFDLLPIAD